MRIEKIHYEHQFWWIRNAAVQEQVFQMEKLSLESQNSVKTTL